MDKLNEVLERLKGLEATTTTGSNFSRLTEIASFMDDLADITQQMEQGMIELEDDNICFKMDAQGNLIRI